jgi:NAD+ synthase (glutamine-hydrolysing)
MKLRAALAQINPTVGDLAGNAALIADSVKKAQDHGANLIVFKQPVSGRFRKSQPVSPATSLP